MEVQSQHDPYSKFQASQDHIDSVSINQSITKSVASVAAATTTKPILNLKKLLYKNSSTVLVQFNTTAGNNFVRFFKVDGTGKDYSFFFPAVYLCQPSIVKLYILSYTLSSVKFLIA